MFYRNSFNPTSSKYSSNSPVGSNRDDDNSHLYDSVIIDWPEFPSGSKSSSTYPSVTGTQNTKKNVEWILIKLLL